MNIRNSSAHSFHSVVKPPFCSVSLCRNPEVKPRIENVAYHLLNWIPLISQQRWRPISVQRLPNALLGNRVTIIPPGIFWELSRDDAILSVFDFCCFSKPLSIITSASPWNTFLFCGCIPQTRLTWSNGDECLSKVPLCHSVRRTRATDDCVALHTIGGGHS